MKLHVVAPFPNLIQLVMDPFSPSIAIAFFLFLFYILKTGFGFLPAWDMQVVGHFSGCSWEGLCILCSLFGDPHGCYSILPKIFNVCPGSKLIRSLKDFFSTPAVKSWPD